MYAFIFKWKRILDSLFWKGTYYRNAVCWFSLGNNENIRALRASLLFDFVLAKTSLIEKKESAPDSSILGGCSRIYTKDMQSGFAVSEYLGVFVPTANKIILIYPQCVI